MNARERKKLFMQLLPEDLPKEKVKVLRKISIPSIETIREQLKLEDLPDDEVLKRYAEHLLKIEDPVAFNKKVQEHAKLYLSLGLKPVPLWPGTKVPIGQKWQEKYLTLGESEIPLVWTGIQNIGLKTGPPSNLLVLDFESEEAFNAWNNVLFTNPEFEEIRDRLIPTWVVRSKRGYHVYYIIEDAPENIEKLKNINAMTHKFFKEFEIRWREGQVAAPPSLHPDGVFYHFVETENGTLGPETVEIKKITVADVARILDAYHKTAKLNVEHFRLNDYMSYLASLLGLEEAYRSGLTYARVHIDFSTLIDNEKEARLLNALQKIWPADGDGRWAASLAISALLGVLGVPLEQTQKLLEKLIRTVQPETDEAHIRKLAYQLPAYSYRDLESYQRQAEEAKKLGKPVPRLPVAYKSIMKAYTPFTEEIIDEARREVEKILGVSFAERLGLKKKQELKEEKDDEHLAQRYLLPNELMISPPKIEIERSNVLPPDLNLDEGEVTIEMKIITIPIVHYSEGTIRYSKKVVKIPLSEEYEPSYQYTEGQPLILKPVKIEKAAYFGEDVYVRLNILGFIYEGTVEEVVAELRRQKLIAPGRGEWVGAYLSFLAQKETGRVFTRIGVHKVDGNFDWISPTHERYYPTSPMKKKFAKAYQLYVENSPQELYKHFIDAIVRYNEHINEEAYWISMSYMFVAPFVVAARRVFRLAPMLYLYNPTAGSGKSSLAKFITQVALGIKYFDQNQLDSSFRFAETFDSIQAPILFDEIHNLKPDILAALITAATGAGSTTRGRGIASMKDYDYLALPVFTSNKEPSELSDTPGWLDRLINVYVEPRTENVKDYLKEIDLPFALQATDDAERVTVAHYFVPELVRIVNKLGGEKWLQERFEKWFDFGIEQGLMQRAGARDVYKFAMLMVGLEIMHRFLSLKGVKLNVKEGARIILNFFKRSARAYPRSLENFVYMLTRLKHPSSNIILIEHTYDERKGAYVITSDIISLIADEAKKTNRTVPAGLSELANIIAALRSFGTREEIYPPSGVKVNGRTRKAVLLPYSLVQEILGYVSPIEEVEESPHKEILNEVAYLLAMSDATFDEIVQSSNIPDDAVRAAINFLIDKGAVYVQNGKYHLIRSKAKELGLDIIEEVRV